MARTAREAARCGVHAIGIPIRGDEARQARVGNFSATVPDAFGGEVMPV